MSWPQELRDTIDAIKTIIAEESQIDGSPSKTSLLPAGVQGNGYGNQGLFGPGFEQNQSVINPHSHSDFNAVANQLGASGSSTKTDKPLTPTQNKDALQTILNRFQNDMQMRELQMTRERMMF